jgi:hypothetical protein
VCGFNCAAGGGWCVVGGASTLSLSLSLSLSLRYVSFTRDTNRSMARGAPMSPGPVTGIPGELGDGGAQTAAPQNLLCVRLK